MAGHGFGIAAAIFSLAVPENLLHQHFSLVNVKGCTTSMTTIHGQHCVISDDALIGEGTRIGNFVLIRDKTVIGKCCVVGSYLYIEGALGIGACASLQSGRHLTSGQFSKTNILD